MSVLLEDFEQQSHFKRGNRVVLQSVKDVAVRGTVKWVGKAITPAQDLPIPVVGIETDKKINPEEDFPGLYVDVNGSHNAKLFKPGIMRGRIFLPEQLVVLADEYAERQEKYKVDQYDKMKADEFGISLEEYRSQKDYLEEANMEKKNQLYAAKPQEENLFIPEEVPPPLPPRRFPRVPYQPPRSPSCPSLPSQFNIGSKVSLPTQNGQPLHGIVKWIGTLPDFPGTIAGIELETSLNGCADGTWQGTRYFNCLFGKGYFYPVKGLRHYEEEGTLPENSLPCVKENPLLNEFDEIRKLRRTIDDLRQQVNVIDNEKKSIEEINKHILKENDLLKKKIHKSKEREQQLLDENHRFLVEQKRILFEKQQLLEEKEMLKRQVIDLSDLYTENQKQIQDQKDEHLHEKLQLENKIDCLKQQIRKIDDNNINYWEISYEQVTTNGIILGTGAWGKLLVGLFQGQKVAVKMLHSEIASQHYGHLVRREIVMMSKVRHPNLILFIGGVLNHPSRVPIIVTELLDTSLREACKNDRISDIKSRLSIMRDTAAGLNYLHCHKEGIIHRDVSSSNVLLEAKNHDNWRAKLSDFGSANLAQYATSKAPGATVYAAPELPNIQTPKMDVYSYGILLCEILTNEFPFPENFPSMLESLSGTNKWLHSIVSNCTNVSPADRPNMSDILLALNENLKDILQVNISDFKCLPIY